MGSTEFPGPLHWHKQLSKARTWPSATVFEGFQSPGARHLLLRAACFLEWAMTGVRLSDSHNGLRGFSQRAVAGIRIRQNRMAHATEIRMNISRVPQWRVVEVPVSIEYTPDSVAKGQRATSALSIVQDLLTQYLFGDSR